MARTLGHVDTSMVSVSDIDQRADVKPRQEFYLWLTGTRKGARDMPRKPRDFKKGYCYHITVRCNSREFRLSKKTLRQTLLYTVDKARGKFRFKLYALCIMSNHVHYLIGPDRPRELSKSCTISTGIRPCASTGY